MKITHLYERPYQPAVFRWMTESLHVNAESALLLATGSGKTTVILAYIAWNFSLPKPHFMQVFVVAPQTSIRDSFRTNARYHVEKGDEGYVLPGDTPLEGMLELGEVIQDPATEPMWFTGTHQILSLRGKDLDVWAERPDDLRGKLLVIDEAHHAQKGNELRRFVEYWTSKGGAVLYATATPKGILHDGVASYHIPLVELMEQRFAPYSILSSFIDTGLSADEEQAVGQEKINYSPRAKTDAEIHQAVAKMVEVWEKDGRPKTIIRIKPTNTITNIRLMTYTRDAFKAVAGEDRVLTIRNPDSFPKGVCNEGFDSSGRLSEELTKERKRKYDESSWDVIVAMNTVIEGVDWPLCSHVFLMGLPDSFLTIVQILGRATRQRTSIEGYPERWVDTSRIVFFVGGVKDDSYMQAHGRPMLMIGCALTSYTVGSQWSTFREDVKLVEDLPKCLDTARQQFLFSEEQRNRITTIREDLLKTFKKDLTTADRLGPTAKAHLQKRWRDLLQDRSQAVGLSEREHQELKRELVQQHRALLAPYVDRIRTGLKEDDVARYVSLQAAVIDELLEMFWDLAAVGTTPGIYRDLEAQGTLQLTAPVLKEITSELIKKCPPRLYKSNIIRQVKTFVKAHSDMSYEEFLRQVDPESFDGDTFYDYHRAVTTGTRGLEKHFDGLKGMVCASYANWSETNTFEDLIEDQAQYKTPWDTVITQNRHKPLIYFYGTELIAVLRQLGSEMCRNINLELAVRISRQRWTVAKYKQFEKLSKTVPLREAFDQLQAPEPEASVLQ